MAKAAATSKASKATRRVIPLDNEPITPAEMRAIREGEEAIARGDYVTLEQIEADLKADRVARSRSNQGSKRLAKRTR